MGRAYEFQTALYPWGVAILLGLIIFDKTKKQILTYISIIYQFALEIPLHIFFLWFYPWKYDNYNIFNEYLEITTVLSDDNMYQVVGMKL